MREKQTAMIFFFSTIELFPLLAQFSLLKYLLWENTAIIR